MNRSLAPLFALSASLVLLACDRGSEREGIREPEPESLEVRLGAVGTSGMTGEARLTPREDKLAVNVVLEGALQDERYVAQLHRGRCGNELGVVAPIGEATVTGGRNRITGSIDRASLAPGESRFVQVLRGEDGTAVACGNVEAAP